MKKTIILPMLLALSLCSCGDSSINEIPPEIFPEHLTLEDLAEYNKGKMPEYNYDTFGVSITGNIAGFKIKNQESALGAIESISELLKIDDDNLSLTLDHFFDNPYDDVYGFQVNYKGVPIYGDFVELYIDKKSKIATSVFSSETRYEEIDLTPQISAEEAVGIAQDTQDDFRTNEKPPVLMIYQGNTLVWYIEGVPDGNTSKEIMINAIDGSCANYARTTVTHGEKIHDNNEW